MNGTGEGVCAGGYVGLSDTPTLLGTRYSIRVVMLRAHPIANLLTYPLLLWVVDDWHLYCPAAFRVSWKHIGTTTSTN